MLPLRFPGTPPAFGALQQMVDAELLGRAAVWAATEKRCAGEIFNVTNGGLFRWQYLWPRFAEYFGMEDAPLRRST
jgi:nucleoside-diphosphate-sugar epimerase